MHDARALLEMGAEAVRRLARRGYSLDLSALESLQSRRNQNIRSADELRAESKRVASEVQQTAKQGGDISKLKERAREIKEQIREIEAEQEQVQDELRTLLLTIPNLPDDRSPDGDSEEFAVEVRRVGTPPSFSFTPKDHVDLGEATGILDFARATKLSGPRFAVSRGAGAALERALTTLFLDLHTRRHDYVEHSVPFLVTRKTMTGTGQLPKFEEDLFKTGVADRELFLIPTAEVPLTNLYADEIIPPSELPLAITAQTPCFRSEAGSYGRDTRGLIRQHQFTKVEMVRICEPEAVDAELEKMLGHAEACLKELGLAYRVVTLAAGDTGFSAQLTYDLEVWFPSQNTYREISSVSNFGTFQARRANIRTRGADGKPKLVTTLNGSGLPVGRTLAALLEQGQQEDGSIVLPESLVPYLGFRRISADGTPEA
ncbi:serine--tRNA ligase [Streptomyces violarus]|uniref:Serine--tRNA ligase n=1 Tax=Streptomyces violarus TaxID=67380 RepID=A0A7W5F0K6_9ACTN|nr:MULTISPECIES: serine--tRNA ligase [Streptomyces]MBB3075544.1 seryl-tRNA synthetase [Streptomyces violarus]WRT98141.1 serine--tRNA ligase [Streptomyces sp. CGMCC 4.1772]GHD04209.1 serine--tRNA ligase [Streptomyces violarus]